MLPIVALVGRPNVGKSTLFNRLLRKSRAITHDLPGVTRDRIYGECQMGDVKFDLVDTGGMVLESEATPELSKDFEDEIFEQAREAINEAHAILFVVDGKQGMSPLDEQAAEFVRRSGKPVMVLVNKVDSHEVAAQGTAEFHALGLPVFPVSAAHGYNLHEVREKVRRFVLDLGMDTDEEDTTERGLRLTMLGRPNAGKSSIINRIIGTDRLIVSDVAGTTRDSIDVTFERQGKRYTFVDTAGVRRRANIQEHLEKISVIRALKNSKRSDVTILVIDITLGVGRQDKRLIEFLAKEKTPFMVVCNKADLIPRSETKRALEAFREELRIIPYVPLIMTSANKGVGIGKIIPLAETLRRECEIRIGTGVLNRALAQVLEKLQPPVVKRRRPKFFYVTQADEPVPTFVFFCNDHTLVKESYARYLENQFRKLLGINSAPVDVVFRSSHDKKEWEKNRGISAMGKRGPGRERIGGAKTRRHEDQFKALKSKRRREDREKKEK
ncbi:MAG: ribosome biogenesis GTPase Der [Pseudodesulfovibrio sp.]|uniref:GTPase Der n=1 Tax=Pseudodesulfovibrio aespoeensis (strain ATCC 700646 / DSM 10631 / Aspo-2) TaxID=643562 RepID=E6VS82_PSEA9|nr:MULTISPECIES: ribosome biogenesis GTPase Der [Pseudodesulfovibrio]MBU4193168.1 ribosome biogenesis GTPase Der [Pseudomonadota bacterium]ADU63127.1 ribosome-associated GTPase EngA [Pseudodesulfovibrio aespoeensis Aspo-2]MBU4245071.1 ribosome biogenesis GTPase Der [Pseudomonadota bacterium]MBU4379564.1 ribosome biogenesis GTPase Der [Pseudomonadota bacterium]MBU4475069.1 ribosome biogenesis GTPase Der [Pseudomonadota bacterium]